MNQIVNINGKAIEQINYKGVPVISMPMIDDLHQRPKKTAAKAFNRHKKKLIEGEDYFVVPQEEWKSLLVVREKDDQKQKNRGEVPSRGTSPANKGGGYSGNMVFLTETGYVMLIKAFDDDLSWQIYRLMVKSYFTERTMVSPSPQQHDIRMTIDIGRLAKQADAHVDGKASLRLLNYLTGIPVNDLVHEIETKEAEARERKPGKDAELLASYLFALVKSGTQVTDVEIGTDEEGCRFVLATTADLLQALEAVGKENRLPKLTCSAAGFGQAFSRQAGPLELLGWRRHLKRMVRGRRYFQYTCLEVEI